MKLVQQLIRDTPYKFGRSSKRSKIVVHETANTRATANAQAHADLQSRGNPAAVSWHYQVDDTYCIQSFTHDFQLWHAGDGAGAGNMHGIAIEMCVNAGSNFTKTIANTADLIVNILKQEKHLTVSNIVQHNLYSGKNCPTNLRANNGRLWNTLISEVRKRVGSVLPEVSNPRPGELVGRVIEIDAWYNYLTAADAKQGRNAQRVMSAGRYKVDRLSDGVPHLTNVNGKESGWVHPSVLNDQTPVDSKPITHTVARGDTLWAISKMYGVTVDRIKALNGLRSNTIYPGQVLKIA